MSFEKHCIKFSISINNDKCVVWLQLQCCGVKSFEDWQYSVWKQETGEKPVRVPDTCCLSPNINCGKSIHPSNIYYAVSDNISTLLVVVTAGCLHPDNHDNILSPYSTLNLNPTLKLPKTLEKDFIGCLRQTK